MISLTDLDLRYADHAARVARVDRAAWMRQEPVLVGGGRKTGGATVVGLMRRHLGEVLVRTAKRVRLAPAAPAHTTIR